MQWCTSITNQKADAEEEKSLLDHFNEDKKEEYYHSVWSIYQVPYHICWFWLR